jgi:hypothetical protein
MDLGSINWLAVLLATLVSFVSGFIWFGPKTFYPVWWKALGKSPNTEPGSQQSMAVVFGSITVALFVQSLVFSIVLCLVFDKNQSNCFGCIASFVPLFVLYRPSSFCIESSQK